MVIAVGGGWLALRLTGSLTWIFAALSLALVVYGTMLAAAIASGVWFRSGAGGFVSGRHERGETGQPLGPALSCRLDQAGAAGLQTRRGQVPFEGDIT